MTATTVTKLAVRTVALVAIAALVAAAAVWLVVRDGQSKQVTAYFTGTVGLYPDSDVRALGVAIGVVEAVEPEGDRVKVTMSVDGDVDVPAHVNALVVTPSLVSDRYVQLAPVYTGGPKLADGAEIPIDRTVVPVELDELFSSMNDLTTALGPKGANANGAFSDLLRSAAANMDGTGKQFGKTVRELGKAARTLADSDDDLFGTVDSLQKFTTMLGANDDDLRAFDQLLAEVAKVFAAEREDFGAAMAELSDALGKVDGFVRENRGAIKSNVDKLAGITKVLARQQKSLSEALREAPEALTNLLRAYDPATATIDSRANLNEFSMNGDTTSGGPPLPLPASGGVG